jgi:hypothetical protein
MCEFAGVVKTPLKQPFDANRAVYHLPGRLQKGCCRCGAAEISCCRCEAMEISCCRMCGTNKCISNIGLISNSGPADARIGIRGRGLEKTLRNIQRGHGSFRLVLLPFLCQRDVRKSHILATEERILLFHVMHLSLSVAAPQVQECTGSPPRSTGHQRW